MNTFQISKWGNLRAISPGKRAKNCLAKKTSQSLRNIVIFLKKCNQKQLFQVQKHEKYLRSKNDFKTPVGAFNQEL